VKETQYEPNTFCWDAAYESVAGPFDQVKGIYDYLGATLAPAGLKLDYERIKLTRPKIAEMLC